MKSNHINQITTTGHTLNKGNYTPVPIGNTEHIYNNGYTVIPKGITEPITRNEYTGMDNEITEQIINENAEKRMELQDAHLTMSAQHLWMR